MFKYISISCNYFKLSVNLLYIYYKNIDIKNNEYWVDKLKNNIENCGCMMIKCIQWILPKLQLIHGNTEISEKFNIFYDNCNIHALEDTKIIFKSEFNSALEDNFKIIKLIGSGSIGQVYLAENIHNKQQYAIKVNHPNILKEYKVFYIFIRFILLFINYKDYLPVSDIYEFITSMKSQINLKNECYFNKEFQEIYKDEDTFIIPKVLLCTENILIMDYINGEIYKDNPDNPYGDFKKLSLLSIFVNNNCLNNVVHGDLHLGNWRIIRNNNRYKLVIYDFGFCFHISREEFIIIDDLLTCDEKGKFMDRFFNYYLSKDYNSEVIYENHKIEYNLLVKKYESIISFRLDDFLNDILHLCISSRVLLSSSCLNGFLLFLQLSGFYDKVDVLSTSSDYPKYIKNIINQCKGYDICDDLVNYLETKVKENDVKSAFSNDFSGLESLAHLCSNNEEEDCEIEKAPEVDIGLK